MVFFPGEMDGFSMAWAEGTILEPQLSNEKVPVCLGYIGWGWTPTQFYGDYFIHRDDKDPGTLNNQDFNGTLCLKHITDWWWRDPATKIEKSGCAPGF